MRDLATYRRTLTHGDEINVDLDNWRRIRTTEPASYESELEGTVYFGTPNDCVRRIERLRDEHGIGYFGASMSFGQHGALEGDALDGAFCEGSDAPVPAVGPQRRLQFRRSLRAAAIVADHGRRRPTPMRRRTRSGGQTLASASNRSALNRLGDTNVSIIE